MHDSQDHHAHNLTAKPDSFLGKPDPGTCDRSDRLAHLIEAMESTLATVETRVARLEEEVRRFQSRSANRS